VRKERIEHVVRNRSSGIAAVAAVLGKYDAGNPRTVARREEDEPPVIAQISCRLASRRGFALVRNP